MIDSPWSESLKLSQVTGLAPGRRLERRLVAGPAERKAIAEHLDAEAIERLEADLSISPWFDGVQIEGRWRAEVVQICGVTLEPFSTALDGAFTVRAVPEHSALAPREAGHEIVVDPDADDPPDVLEDDVVDLAGYVVEHLALEVDPFPRKPGVEFTLPEQPRESSPFDLLRNLKGGPGEK